MYLPGRLVDTANTGYNKQGGYEYINKFEYLKTGRIQIIKAITEKMHYERGKNVEWSDNYYGFKKAGRLCGSQS